MISDLTVRKATSLDRQGLWELIEPILRKGGTYVFSPEKTQSEMMDYWLNSDKQTYVLVEEGRIMATFYLKPNQPDLGNHICNAGFMVSTAIWGKGIGRKLGIYALEEARRQGFRAMQFNFVIKTNERAIKLWESLGFQVIGEVPSAYRHPQLGDVPALIMYIQL